MFFSCSLKVNTVSVFVFLLENHDHGGHRQIGILKSTISNFLNKLFKLNKKDSAKTVMRLHIHCVLLKETMSAEGLLGVKFEKEIKMPLSVVRPAYIFQS
jgi:hypothetical protein